LLIHPLTSSDSTGALETRMKLFVANNVVKPENRKWLLGWERDRWVGTLVPELPGIYHWVQQLDLNVAKEFVVSCKVDENLMEGLNSLKDWCEECLMPGEGSYVGYKTNLSDKQMSEAQRRGLVYPFYCDWCGMISNLPLI
jgi:hypothetical protein